MKMNKTLTLLGIFHLFYSLLLFNIATPKPEFNWLNLPLIFLVWGFIELYIGVKKWTQIKAQHGGRIF